MLQAKKSYADNAELWVQLKKVLIEKEKAKETNDTNLIMDLKTREEELTEAIKS